MREVFIEGLVATLGGSALSINVAEASSARGLTAIKGIIVSVGKAVSVGRLLRSLDCKVWFGTRQHPGFGSYTCGRANRLNRRQTRAGPLLGYPQRQRKLWGYNRRLKLHSIPDTSDGIIALPWRKQRKYSCPITPGYSPSDDLTVMPTFFAAPDGKLSIVLHHSWCGD